MSSVNEASKEDVEFIFLGTGTSSSLPNVACLTAPPNEAGWQCRTCLSTLKPEGKNNIRRNTSAVMRMPAKDGTDENLTIVIDVGKNFQAAAVEWFPRYGLRKIDAVIITHAHADAMNGLDDLRGWTLGAIIQPHIDLYVSQATFEAVEKSFPYLVSKEFASGGGDIPEFKWHIIQDGLPFQIRGITITPFAVHHGLAFVSRPPMLPSTSASNLNLNGLRLEDAPAEVTVPYLCFGFKIDNSILYLSDVSHIPDHLWPLLTGTQIPLCILDCLHIKPHVSHFGVEQSVEIARRIGAKRTYWVGFSHRLSHDEYVTIGEGAGGKLKEESLRTENEQIGLGLVGTGPNVWVRPAHDGLRAFVRSGTVIDETYD